MNTHDLTVMVKNTIKEYVLSLPVSACDMDAVAMLKQYLVMDDHKKDVFTRTKYLKEQTFDAMFRCRTAHSKWVFDSDRIPEIHISLITEITQNVKVTPQHKPNNNGWGKTFDTSRVFVREATFEDMKDNTTKGKAKNPSGKKTGNNKGGK